MIRDFPDGRDLNRCFPGKPDSNTTSRVAHKLWSKLISTSDYVVDLHSAAKGRTNIPQIRANLAHASSNRIARSFGIETILDSKGPRGSMRRVANEEDIACITYEGGGSDEADPESVQISMYGIINLLRSLRMLPGYPSKPSFRILASGSVWIRSDQGGLLDVLAQPRLSRLQLEHVVRLLVAAQQRVRRAALSSRRRLLRNGRRIARTRARRPRLLGAFGRSRVDL